MDVMPLFFAYVLGGVSVLLAMVWLGLRAGIQVRREAWREEDE